VKYSILPSFITGVLENCGGGVSEKKIN
jgi:hypothetical protein